MKYITYEEPLKGKTFTEKQMHEVYRDMTDKKKNIQTLTVGKRTCLNLVYLKKLSNGTASESKPLFLCKKYYKEDTLCVKEFI